MGPLETGFWSERVSTNPAEVFQESHGVTLFRLLPCPCPEARFPAWCPQQTAPGLCLCLQSVGRAGLSQALSESARAQGVHN